MGLSDAILELRTANALSQEELAERLFVSRHLVSKWERGERNPDYPMIETIAGLFGVPVERLVDRRDLVFRELGDCLGNGVQLDETRLTEYLNRFLSRLPRRTADIFLNRYYLLKTTAEIADKYGIGENHVRSILSKTRKRLKKALKEEEK